MTTETVTDLPYASEEVQAAVKRLRTMEHGKRLPDGDLYVCVRTVLGALVWEEKIRADLIAELDRYMVMVSNVRFAVAYPPAPPPGSVEPPADWPTHPLQYVRKWGWWHAPEGMEDPPKLDPVPPGAES